MNIPTMPQDLATDPLVQSHETCSGRSYGKRRAAEARRLDRTCVMSCHFPSVLDVLPLFNGRSDITRKELSNASERIYVWTRILIEEDTVGGPWGQDISMSWNAWGAMNCAPTSCHAILSLSFSKAPGFSSG